MILIKRKNSSIFGTKCGIVKQKKMKLAELIKGVDAQDVNIFKLISEVPKWGNDDDDVDALGVELNRRRDRALRSVSANAGIPPFALCHVVRSLHHLDGHEMVKFMEWAQHIATFRGGAHEYIADVALVFKIHITLGLFILVIFPFTRLVHALSAPIGYASRPYQIVRKRAR